MTDPASRFAFGRNWHDYLRALTPERVASAEASLRALLGDGSLTGRTFLDAGSGSGLFSLAARRLGASVVSLDFDADSVACATALRERWYPGDAGWTVLQGSVLDPHLAERVGGVEVIYCWGVLHHTGHQWSGFDALARLVPPGGLFVVALYNDQGWISRYWRMVKRVAHSGPVGKSLMIAMHAPYLVGARWLVRKFRGEGPLPRGMSLRHDLVDWIAGWPFEVAAPDEVARRAHQHGLVVQRAITCGRRHGCNEFVLERPLA